MLETIISKLNKIIMDFIQVESYFSWSDVEEKMKLEEHLMKLS